MNKLTIALCDDDETAVTIIGGTLKSLLDKKNVEAEIFAYLSVHELRKSMESRAYDLVLLDISMKEEDGAEAWYYYGKSPEGESARATLRQWAEQAAQKGDAQAAAWLREMK